MLKTRLIKVYILLTLGAILIASCGGNAPDATSSVHEVGVVTWAKESEITPMVTPVPSTSNWARARSARRGASASIGLGPQRSAVGSRAATGDAGSAPR